MTQPNERRLTPHRVRELTVIGLVSDDQLMDQLVLKGGNAIDMFHGGLYRVSKDVDFSIDGGDFEASLDDVQARISNRLNEAFGIDGYAVFDVFLQPRPDKLSAEFESFWGGYFLEFKVSTPKNIRDYGEDIQTLRRRSVVIGPAQQRKMRVDFSRHEHCKGKQQRELDGYTLYVYSPLMIVAEKIRALCQQMPEYREMLKSPAASPRARDFFDVHTIVKERFVDLGTQEAALTVRMMFEAKRVPLNLIGLVETTREFHRENFDAVEQTLPPGVDVYPFDFYFDFVIAQLEALRKVHPPLW